MKIIILVIIGVISIVSVASYLLTIPQENIDENPSELEIIDESLSIPISVDEDPNSPKHINDFGPDWSEYKPPDWIHAEYHDDFTVYVPPEYVHVGIGSNDDSRYFPEDYKHANEGGSENSGMIPGDYKHATIGISNTRYVPEDNKHASQQGNDHSTYVPNSYIHANVAGFDFSVYFPPEYVHATIDGPEKSLYVINTYKHANQQGDDFSRYLPPDQKHANQEGGDHSTYVQEDWFHMDKGPEASFYSPPGEIHVVEGPDKSRYFDDSYKHISQQGPDHSRYLPWDWKHQVLHESPSTYERPDYQEHHTWINDDWSHSDSLLLMSNDEFISNLYAKIDFDDSNQVFEFVFNSLDDEVMVFPTENYYYFRLPGEKVSVWGSMSLFAHNRDNGILGFGYSEKSNEFISPFFRGKGGGGTLSENDGVIVSKINDFKYSVSYNEKTVIFNLNDIGLEHPQKSKLMSNEIFVGPSFDESGIRFFLIFNEIENKLYWILNEDESVPENFVNVSNDLIQGVRTKFVFYEDRINSRKILVGVNGINVLQNNWYDGPFDQMPDNYVYTNEIEVKKYLEASYPGLKNRIDKYGNYLDEEGIRVAVAPYRVYFDLQEFEFIEECKSKPNLSKFYSCITQQSFEVPSDLK